MTIHHADTLRAQLQQLEDAGLAQSPHAQETRARLAHLEANEGDARATLPTVAMTAAHAVMQGRCTRQAPEAVQAPSQTSRGSLRGVGGSRALRAFRISRADHPFSAGYGHGGAA